MPGGKSASESTESKLAVILPVSLEITKVAADTLPDLTARDEATTLTMEASASICPLGGDLGGVGYEWKLLWLLFMVRLDRWRLLAGGRRCRSRDVGKRDNGEHQST